MAPNESSRPQHPKLHLSPAAEGRNLTSLKRINSLLLPINYRETFYKDILTNAVDAALSKVAFWEGGVSVIGGIRARWEPSGRASSTDSCPRGGKVYLMTICVLSPYRRLGVATALLEDIVETAKKWDVEEVYAHVWVENHDALDWYKRRGFTVDEEVIKGYYKRLQPNGARIVRLKLAGA